MAARGDPYHSLARVYDPVTALFLDPVRRLVADTLCQLEAATVLDVCCGTGRLVAGLRRDGLFAVGADASPAMLAVARRTIGPGICSRMDARSLAFADASFDATVITFALHENPEPDRLAMVGQMLRVTRSGGHALLVDYQGPPWPRCPLGWLVPLAEWSAGREHFRNYRDFVARKGVAALVRRLGGEPPEGVGPRTVLFYYDPDCRQSRVLTPPLVAAALPPGLTDDLGRDHLDAACRNGQAREGVLGALGLFVESLDDAARRGKGVTHD